MGIFSQLCQRNKILVFLFTIYWRFCVYTGKGFSVKRISKRLRVIVVVFLFFANLYSAVKKKKIGLSNVSSVFTCLANEVILKQRKAVATRERGKMDVAAKILHLQPCGTEKLHRNPLSLKTGH